MSYRRSNSSEDCCFSSLRSQRVFVESLRCGFRLRCRFLGCSPRFTLRSHITSTGFALHMTRSIGGFLGREASLAELSLAYFYHFYFNTFVAESRKPATPNHALQRTAPCVTAPASTTAFPPTMQVPRRTPPSLSLGSLGVARTPCR